MHTRSRQRMSPPRRALQPRSLTRRTLRCQVLGGLTAPAQCSTMLVHNTSSLLCSTSLCRAHHCCMAS